MELIKHNINMNKLQDEAVTQITLDDDININDNKPDVEKIIKEQGSVEIQDVRVQDGKVNIKGMLHFCILYVSGENSCVINSMKGSLPFEDIINMSNITSQDVVNVKNELEDLTTILINSRKISIRAIVSLVCISEKIYDEEVAVDVEKTDSTNLQYIKRTIKLSQIVINKKDIFRIKDEIILSVNKKNINEILYSDAVLRNTEFRTIDEQLLVKGDMLVFIIYLTEEGDYDYIEKEISINGNLEMAGSTSE